MSDFDRGWFRDGQPKCDVSIRTLSLARQDVDARSGGVQAVEEAMRPARHVVSYLK